jgi:DNA-binding SARP family transcriptional activator/Tfp pilus assembly protein PilF
MVQSVPLPPALEIRLLGPFRVMADGAAVAESHWARRKPALLIKLLSLQPHHRLHREQVMECLWPDLDIRAATNNLHKAIHAARRALEPGLESGPSSRFILTSGQQVKLGGPGGVWVDCAEFERRAAAALAGADPAAFADALALYGGDLLADDPYEDWAAARRERLRAQHLQLLSNLAALHEARGEHGPAVERLKELLTGDPTNEEAHRRLMRLYALAGDKQSALRQYTICSQELRRELDAEPERDTAELRRQIAVGRFSTAPPPGAAEIGAGTGAGFSSLAILPLLNDGGEEGAEYFADGITESLINSLSQLTQLRVMARSTVFRYKGCERDPREVGRELGVRAVLTGRVHQRGDTLVIQAELADASDGSQLWGERYRRSASDVFAVQEEISRDIAQKLRLRLSDEERGRLSKRHTGSAEAYRLYLKGRYHWNKRTVEALWKGIECFRQAISLDPDFAPAHAGVSDCYAFLGDVGLTAISCREAFSKARQAARRALAIDDALAEAHVSLAHMSLHYFDWAEAEREFKRAIELNPNHAVAHQWYAYYLLFQRRNDEAVREAARGLELDPLSLSANGDMGQILYYTRQYDAGIEQYLRTLDLEPHFSRQHLWLGWAYLQKGLHGEAIADFQRAAEHSEGSEVLVALACAHAATGETAEARSILAGIGEMSGRTYVSPYSMALVHLALGEKEEAFAWLEKAYRQRAEWMIYFGVDPRLDGLRADPRYGELLRRVGLAP